MDEPTDAHPPPTRRRRATAGRLSPAQEAWGRYVNHATNCARCRDVDMRCDDAEGLWRSWRKLSEAAIRQIRHT